MTCTWHTWYLIEYVPLTYLGTLYNCRLFLGVASDHIRVHVRSIHSRIARTKQQPEKNMILLQNPTHIVAQDFEIDTRSGFVPSNIPISRLPTQWEAWECALDNLKANRLQLGDKPNLSAEDTSRSEAWRARIREVHCPRIRPLLDIILMLSPISCQFYLSQRCRNRRSFSAEGTKSWHGFSTPTYTRCHHLHPSVSPRQLPSLCSKFALFLTSLQCTSCQTKSITIGHTRRVAWMLYPLQRTSVVS